MSATDVKESYKYYADRLGSFKGWPNRNIKREALAKAGFFYTKIDDETKCPYCRFTKQSWKKSDKPLEEHRKISPTCPFIKQLSATDLATIERQPQPLWHSLKVRLFPIIDQPIKIVPKICHPMYENDEQRLETFSKWPTSANKPSRENLAEAGFFYNGIDDQTICFNCGVCLKGWREKGDPWEVHAYWNPKCGYVLYKKGYEFIQDVHRRNAGYRHY